MMMCIRWPCSGSRSHYFGSPVDAVKKTSPRIAARSSFKSFSKQSARGWRKMDVKNHQPHWSGWEAKTWSDYFEARRLLVQLQPVNGWLTCRKWIQQLHEDVWVGPNSCLQRLSTAKTRNATVQFNNVQYFPGFIFGILGAKLLLHSYIIATLHTRKLKYKRHREHICCLLKAN